jgi:surfeit locus 1 family protein
VVVIAAAIAATTALGFWQVRRAEGKEVLQREIDAAAAAIPAAPDAPALRGPASLVHRHLRFEGRWRPDDVVYLDNRPQAGQAGFYVLMALHVERPFPADVIVDRGWLPRDSHDRARIAPYRTPDGPVVVTGVALADEPRLLELSRAGERSLSGIWQNFDFDAYARAAGRTPVGLIVRQDRDGAVDDGLSREWPDRGGDLQGQIDRHHGYAFQWFALAAALTAFLLYRAVRAIRYGRSDP